MSGRFIRLRSPIVSWVVALATIVAVVPGGNAQQERPRRAVPLQQTPREVLEQARSAPTSDERISGIEKFIAANRGVAIEIEAREALMREYALRAKQRLRDGDPQQATSDFKAAFRAAPAEITDRVFSQYVFPMPVAMNSFGYRTESAELMRSFEGRFQNNVNRLIQIGFFYVQIEAPLEAVRTLERAVELAPQDSRGHNSLGSAYLINLRLDDAQAEFRRALELNPKDEYANLNLANLARSKGAMDRAIDYYQKQLALKPDDGEAYGGLAIALLGAGRDEEAERALKKALEIEPENYRLLTQLAFYY
ncbi:MAG TPA: tetratricopeptide repeat protein, partial [Blastocatellia bacterium]|nr:tetratricopeptide repeat protein [Blastocatellia bacterium]